ncbi:MAG: alpha/beta hydrolase [Candidatus Lokiarchaeota archaeon]
MPKCDLEKIAINYELFGKGTPIIFLPGYGLDNISTISTYEPILKDSKEWMRIYPDLPGTGKTEAADWITSADDFLKIFEDFINTIIPNQDFLVVGESYGGYLAQGLLKNHFSHIKGICLLFSVVEPNHSRRKVEQFIVFEQDKKLLAHLNPKERKEFSEWVVIQNEKTWKSYKEGIINSQKYTNEKFLTKIQQNAYGFSFNMAKEIPQCDFPALILTGRQDSSVGFKDAWSLIDRFPRASFVALDKAGHCLEIEQEEIVKVLFLEWLDRVEKIL